MNENNYRCRQCGKEKSLYANEAVPECCNEPMELLGLCREAPSAEHARWTNEDKPCDDGSSGYRI